MFIWFQFVKVVLTAGKSIRLIPLVISCYMSSDRDSKYLIFTFYCKKGLKKVQCSS